MGHHIWISGGLRAAPPLTAGRGPTQMGYSCANPGASRGHSENLGEPLAIIISIIALTRQAQAHALVYNILAEPYKLRLREH